MWIRSQTRELLKLSEVETFQTNDSGIAPDQDGCGKCFSGKVMVALGSGEAVSGFVLLCEDGPTGGRRPPPRAATYGGGDAAAGT